jgi:hypothetical protein
MEDSRNNYNSREKGLNNCQIILCVKNKKYTDNGNQDQGLQNQNQWLKDQNQGSKYQYIKSNNKTSIILDSQEMKNFIDNESVKTLKVLLLRFFSKSPADSDENQLEKEKSTNKENFLTMLNFLKEQQKHKRIGTPSIYFLKNTYSIITFFDALNTTNKNNIWNEIESSVFLNKTMNHIKRNYASHLNIDEEWQLVQEIRNKNSHLNKRGQKSIEKNIIRHEKFLIQNGNPVKNSDLLNVIFTQLNQLLKEAIDLFLSKMNNIKDPQNIPHILDENFNGFDKKIQARGVFVRCRSIINDILLASNGLNPMDQWNLMVYLYQKMNEAIPSNMKNLQDNSITDTINIIRNSQHFKKNPELISKSQQVISNLIKLLINKIHPEKNPSNQDIKNILLLLNVLKIDQQCNCTPLVPFRIYESICSFFVKIKNQESQENKVQIALTKYRSLLNEFKELNKSLKKIHDFLNTYRDKNNKKIFREKITPNDIENLKNTTHKYSQWINEFIEMIFGYTQTSNKVQIKDTTLQQYILLIFFNGFFMENTNTSVRFDEDFFKNENLSSIAKISSIAQMASSREDNKILDIIFTIAKQYVQFSSVKSISWLIKKLTFLSTIAGFLINLKQLNEEIEDPLNNQLNYIFNITILNPFLTSLKNIQRQNKNKKKKIKKASDQNIHESEQDSDESQEDGEDMLQGINGNKRKGEDQYIKYKIELPVNEAQAK